MRPNKTRPRTLAAFTAYLDKRKLFHMIDGDTPTAVSGYADKLRHLPSNDRELVRAIVEKALAVSRRHQTDYGVHVHPDDLKFIIIDNKRLSDYRIGKLGRTLERHGLGSLDHDEEPDLRVSSPDECMRWSLLKGFLESRGRGLGDLICDLQFGLLD